MIHLKRGSVAPFTVSGGGEATASAQHSRPGEYSLKLEKGYVVLDGAQDWSGFDYLKANVFNESTEPTQIYVEIHDKGTRDYWTRVNYNTVVPPGNSTLVVPTDLFVGEKARPGRPLIKSQINVFVLSIGDAKAPIYFDNLRLEKDPSSALVIPGLLAFSFGPANGHVMKGFTAVSPNTIYSPQSGFGLIHGPSTYAYDVLQPDPLYQRGMAFFTGGFRANMPNGKYHVFLNLDNPSGFWGEYPVYRERSVKANGVEVVHDVVDLPAFLKRYYRFADVEDRMEDNTFDKYQREIFHEKEFDVDVKDGHLDLDFKAEGLGDSVSALVIYPVADAVKGQKYLAQLLEKRRFNFDNSFKRIAPSSNRDSKGLVPAFVPTSAELAKGHVLFARDWMEDVPVNAIPRRSEITNHLNLFANAGQMEPIVFSIKPFRSLGKVVISATDLISGSARIPSSAIQPGLLSHRITRVTPEGSVFTIAPRFILPRSEAELHANTTTTFWLTLNTPRSLKAGTYKGQVVLRFADGSRETIDLSVRLFATRLDPLDVAAGPWGNTIDLPWFAEDLGDRNRMISRLSMAKMASFGCTTFSGIPTLKLTGWNHEKPIIDFAKADEQMSDAKAAGFRSIVVNYNGGIQGFDNYHVDNEAMKKAGFSNYIDFLRPILRAIDDHAKASGWLPVAFNLCDEPVTKEEVDRAITNAEAWREAAPAGILTTGATSITNPKPDDVRLPLVKALKIPNLNEHDTLSVSTIHQAGNQWAFYNGGNRWTFGTYMFKAAQEFGMKFRLSWHWNAAAGDPFYALDCREDDYAWCVTNSRMEMIPTIHFDRDIRAGIDDYRSMLTLERLIHAHPNHPYAKSAQKLLDDKLGAFQLGDRDHNAKWPVSEFREYRLKLAEAIEKLAGGS